MTTISATVFRENQSKYTTDILSGAVLIYPTDTIYGIGCDATNTAAVEKIRAIKQRDTKPFSVIAPSKNWILDNCDVPSFGKEWLAKLPGAYTLILKLRNKSCISSAVNGGATTLGVRIPAHWISETAAKLNKPIVTTSVNISGQAFATSVTTIDKTILSKADIVILDADFKSGKPSTLVDLTGTAVDVRQR